MTNKQEERAEIIDSERWSDVRFNKNGRLYTSRASYRVFVPSWAKDLDSGELEAFLWLLAVNLRADRSENICIKTFLPGQHPDEYVFATLTWDGQVVMGMDRTFNMIDDAGSYN